MSELTLVIGNKAYSSWSLRPWLALRHIGVPFAEVLVHLRQPDSRARILQHSPSGKVPLLKHGDRVVWDSLAICEYLHERFPNAGLWPRQDDRRALGRSACAEMHSGFQSLRGECPMALGEQHDVGISPATEANVRRIVELWNDLLHRFGGPFLLGDWSIADAYYTPVATRFRTYAIALSDYGDAGPAGAYASRLLATPEFLEWERDALADA